MEVEDYPEEVAAGIPLIRVVGVSDDRLIGDGGDYMDQEEDVEIDLIGGDPQDGYDSGDDASTQVC